MRIPGISIRKISAAIMLVFVVGLSFFGATAAHAEYECGTYGAGDGFGLDNYASSNCDSTAPITETNTSTTTNTSKTGGGTTTSTAHDDQTSPTPVDVTEETTINLNDYADYLSGVGQSLELTQGQVVHFAFNGKQYTITIKSVNDTYIIATIASTPHDVTVQKDQTVKYDIDGDGSTDISLTYVSATAGVATIIFNQLVKPAPSPAPNQPSYWWILWTGIGIIIVIVVLVTVKLRKPTAKDQ